MRQKDEALSEREEIIKMLIQLNKVKHRDGDWLLLRGREAFKSFSGTSQAIQEAL